MKVQYYAFLNFLLNSNILAANCEVPQENYFTLNINSNTLTEIVDSSSNYLQKAVLCNVAGGWTNIQGSSWIWRAQNPSVETIYVRSRFYIYGVPSSGTIQVACDDSLVVYVNGIKVGCSGASYDYVKSCNVLSTLISGLNTALFVATNTGGPGGLVFKISVKALL